MDAVTPLARRGRAAVAAATLVLAAAVPALTLDRGDALEQGVRCVRAHAKAEAKRALDTGRGAAVVVIGDSYAVGAAGDPRDAWPRRLPGRVHVDAFSGSGFSAGASPCGAVSYADRAAAALTGHPDAVVVVQGGLNDHAQDDDDIVAGLTDLVRALDGHPVLLVGPPPAPGRAAEVPRVDAVLAGAAAAAGTAYLSMADADIDYTPDGLHPTRHGHRQFGDLVAAEVARFVVTQPMILGARRGHARVASAASSRRPPETLRGPAWGR